MNAFRNEQPREVGLPNNFEKVQKNLFDD